MKKRIATELKGKKITDAQQAEKLISSVYSRYRSKGLKGIRLLYDPKSPDTAGIKVSASIAEVIKTLPLTSVKEAEVLRGFANDFTFLILLLSLFPLMELSFG